MRKSRNVRDRGRSASSTSTHCAQLSGAEIALLRLLPALEDVDAHVILLQGIFRRALHL